MAQSVAVINGKPGRNLAAQFPQALVWKTCLREIAILDASRLSPNDLTAEDELYLRQDAYQFLLEVICGLHSPVVGETEVLGQFKNFAVRAQESGASRCTTPWMQRLIADAKKIRTNHLTGLGARSYGQLSHRHLADCDRILILGAGHLAEEVIGWFEEQEVDVFCRRPEAAGSLHGRHAGATIHKIGEAPATRSGENIGLVVAAPMTAADIESWAAALGCPIRVVVDLRGESGVDPISMPASHVVHFQEILDAVEKNNRFANVRVEAARREIAGCAQEFWDRYEIRPFGWEDLCA